MEEIKGKPLLAALDGLYGIVDTKDAKWLIGKDKAPRAWLNLLITSLEPMGCTQSIKKARSIIGNFDIALVDDSLSQTVLNKFPADLKELHSRLRDEIEDQKLYCITARDAEALRPVGQVYGVEVEAAFNGSVFDLEEASKSIAFGRGTAGVFHLMRAMETAVKLAGTVLGAAIVDKNDRELEWGKIVANMKAKIEAKPKDDPHKSDWSEVQSLLFHVKDAWRNTTMHPKQTYTLEEASEVLAAVRAFLRRLAPLV